MEYDYFLGNKENEMGIIKIGKTELFGNKIEFIDGKWMLDGVDVTHLIYNDESQRTKIHNTLSSLEKKKKEKKSVKKMMSGLIGKFKPKTV